MLWGCVLLTLLVPPSLGSDTDAPERHVLLLFSDHTLASPGATLFNGLRETLSRDAGDRIALRMEVVDVEPSARDAHDRALATWLRDRFTPHAIDVVVSVGDEASTFAVRYAVDLWPRASVVFVAVDEDWLAATRRPPRSTAVMAELPYLRTARAALALLPGTTRIVLLSGPSAEDRRCHQVAQKHLSRLSEHADVVELPARRYDDMARQVGGLLESDVLLATTVFGDAAEDGLATDHAIADLSRRANRPMFTIHESHIGAGTVGGLVVDHLDIGRQSGRLVRRILDGEDPSRIPVVRSTDSRWIFDDRQLRRWKIDERLLPAGSDVRFREPSTWERARGPVLGVSATGLVAAMMIGSLLIAARARKTARSALNDGPDAFSRAVVSSISGEVALLDAHGVVVAANPTWEQCARDGENPGVAALPTGSPGRAWQSRAHDAVSVRVMTAVRAVRQGEQELSALEYGWRDASGPRWSEIRVRRLDSLGGALLVTHVDITARKRAEAEIHKHLHELAHVNMISAMGEVAASVAHELNQPLTAVLSNAQAARRILSTDGTHATELREILDDIIEQDKRAGDVIQRIRRLLKKDEFEWVPLDISALVTDVVRLLANQAALAGVTVVTDLASGPPKVRGDRVQLQQVVLNLVLNGIQSSSADLAVRRRRVSIATRIAGDSLHLLVRDSGAGIVEDACDHMFEPFFTTKRDGLGIGLSISRSIVELHSGQIEARNLAAGGAEFSVTLPLEGGEAA